MCPGLQRQGNDPCGNPLEVRPRSAGTSGRDYLRLGLAVLFLFFGFLAGFFALIRSSGCSSSLSLSSGLGVAFASVTG